MMMTPPMLADLDARYFELPNGLTGLSQIDFFTLPALSDGGDAQGPFAAQLSGQLTLAAGGRYDFYIPGVGEAELFVDGVLTATEDSNGGLQLAAGTHALELRFVTDSRDRMPVIDWQGPETGGSRQALLGAETAMPFPKTGAATMALAAPMSMEDGTDGGAPEPLTKGVRGFEASYYLVNGQVAKDAMSADDVFSGEASATGAANALDFLRTGEAFWEDGAKNNFAAQYSGNLNIETGGSYVFKLRTDDESELYIDGVKVVSADEDNQVETLEAVLDLAAGDHTIEVRYADAGGLASLYLDWRGPDTDDKKVLLDSNYVGTGPTEAEIEAYVAAVRAMPDAMANGDETKVEDHMAALDLVPRDEATHIALFDGDWFDPGNWYNGEIPGPGAKVLIPEGVSINL